MTPGQKYLLLPAAILVLINFSQAMGAVIISARKNKSKLKARQVYHTSIKLAIGEKYIPLQHGPLSVLTIDAVSVVCLCVETLL